MLNKIELINSKCRALIFPKYGGMVNHFYTRINDKEVDLIYGYDESEDIDKQIGVDFRNVKLSPYPNRVKNGKYRFLNKEYQLNINFRNENNSIHGFLYDKQFTVESVDEKSACLRYTVKKDQIEGYPFSYECSLFYELLNQGLSCITEIRNLSDGIIPIADGFHPYFRLDTNISKCSLKLPSCKKLELENGIPTMECMNYDHFVDEEVIGNKEFDDCFEIKLEKENSMAATVLRHGDFSIVVKQEIGPNKYNYLQIYTPPNRESIAIEPMTSAPNCFNNELGLICLEAGEKVRMKHQFEVVNLLSDKHSL